MANSPFHTCRNRSQTPESYIVQSGWQGVELVVDNKRILTQLPVLSLAYGLDSVKECRYDVADDPACKGCTIPRAVMPMKAFSQQQNNSKE